MKKTFYCCIIFFAGIILSSCEKDLDISQTNVNGELLSISLNSLNLEMLDRMSEGDTLFFTPNFENNDIFQKRGFSTRPGMYENEVYGYFTKQTVRMKFYRRPDGSTVVPYYLCDFPDFHLYEKYTIEIKIPLTANQAARGFVGPKSGWEGATLNYQMPHQDEKTAPTNDGLILKTWV